MTPDELDAIVDSFRQTHCHLCAAPTGPYPHTRLYGLSSQRDLCSDCASHVAEHKEGLFDEPRAEQILLCLGLTKGCRHWKPTVLADEVDKDGFTHRELIVSKELNMISEHSPVRQTIQWARYCAFYARHTVDFLVASQGGGRPLACFLGFMWVLHSLESRACWSRYLQSDDPRAASGNKLAVVLAEQILLHVPRWERQIELLPGHPLVLISIRNACFVLAHVLYMQVDKPAAVRLPPKLRSQVNAVTMRWWRRWSDDQSISESLETVLWALFRGDAGHYAGMRQVRDFSEGMHTCARDGCTKSTNLYQCSQCRVVLYCSRKHQAEDWKADPLPHRQICFRPCF